MELNVFVKNLTLHQSCLVILLCFYDNNVSSFLVVSINFVSVLFSIV